MSLWRNFLEWVASKLPKWTIPLDDGNPYLTRHYILLKDRKWFNIFLHYFHVSDELVFHSHPFPGFSIILSGTYIEFRRYKNNEIKSKVFSFGSLNFIGRKTFHRVDLLSEGVWTLFITGPRSKANDWYFWNSETNETYHYKTRPGAID